MNVRSSFFLFTLALLAYPVISQGTEVREPQVDGKIQTSKRAVVVIEGGGSPHPFTTPWAACDDGRPTYVQALLDAGLPVFTAPGYGNQFNSTATRSGCPPQPPTDVQWNTSGYPTQGGQAVLGLLGYLHETYGYNTFDLVGYSYGGLIARATIAALKQQAITITAAPGFSYAKIALNAGISIPSLVTINSPHLGAPTYDVAWDPKAYLAKVTKVWGPQYAASGKGLIDYERFGGAGAIQVLRTGAHAKNDPGSWDAQQVGVLDGVKLTLIAGDYCGRLCGDLPENAKLGFPQYPFRTDATVPVYSQLMLPCPLPCRAPPGSVYIPPGMVPEESVVRRSFPTVHSRFDTKRLKLPSDLSVAENPEAIGFLVSTVSGTIK